MFHTSLWSWEDIDLSRAHLLLTRDSLPSCLASSVLHPLSGLIEEMAARGEDTTLNVGLQGCCASLSMLTVTAGDLTLPAKQRHLQRALQCALAEGTSKHLVFDISGIDLREAKAAQSLSAALITLFNQCYQLPQLGYNHRVASQNDMTLQLLVAPRQRKQAAQLLLETEATASGMLLARRLADTPSHDCTPASFAEIMRHYAEQYPQLLCKVLDEQALQQDGLGALYAVGKGSHHPPRLAVLRYRDGGKAPSVALVGKGITFDSGGLWLKSGEAMRTMKYDMCGAAVVFGVLDVVQRLQWPINLDVVVALAENMPTDRAMRPGDVVKTLAGHQVEIINTDAEGRLALADAIAYADQHFAPACIIDVATLTGAVVKALGYDLSGLMSNDANLLQALLEAGESSQDRAWSLPYDDSFEPQVKSHIADLCNTPPNSAAIAVSAGYFLGKFCPNRPWAHLDISGTALSRGQFTQASGRPIPLLTHFLKQYITQNIKQGERNEKDSIGL